MNRLNRTCKVYIRNVSIRSDQVQKSILFVISLVCPKTIRHHRKPTLLLSHALAYGCSVLKKTKTDVILLLEKQSHVPSRHHVYWTRLHEHWITDCSCHLILEPIIRISLIDSTKRKHEGGVRTQNQKSIITQKGKTRLSSIANTLKNIVILESCKISGFVIVDLKSYLSICNSRVSPC